VRLALAALAAAALAPSTAAGDLDAELYAGILLRHTREVADVAGVRVDYRGLAGAPEWTRLVARLAAADPERLGEGSVGHRERLAFWINAYNILAIELVVRHPGVASIREIGSLLRPVWSREVGPVGGRGRSLGEIEHEILRPLGDPRIHGAIVCASVSCPPLRREPFAAERIDEQLDEQLRRWLASPEKGLRVDAGAGTLHLSRIFDWFEADFEATGGVLAFVARRAPDAEGRWIAEHADRVRVRYLPYDWDLNALAP
jgi:hypothetical protein